MNNRLHQALIDDYDVASGTRPARPEPSLPYVVAVKFFRYTVGLGLLVGAGACVVHFFSTLARS